MRKSKQTKNKSRSIKKTIKRNKHKGGSLWKRLKRLTGKPKIQTIPPFHPPDPIYATVQKMPKKSLLPPPLPPPPLPPKLYKPSAGPHRRPNVKKYKFSSESPSNTYIEIDYINPSGKLEPNIYNRLNRTIKIK